MTHVKLIWGHSVALQFEMDLRRYCKHTITEQELTETTAGKTILTMLIHQLQVRKYVQNFKTKYNKKWENSFEWLNYYEDVDEAFCSTCQK